ncbi:protein kinase [Actinoallomurus purpureus]|uniref:WD40 repeat domain-containing serine/threonine protein kinase n=1 Tax=Actinoallomurus purpureus TaxID=478114 RepID=UPI002092985B|nr:protein kinase [Actinoallomurus purpureus]MCO6009286.1 protein kinase [Actinoallomurus purpureus]
MEGTPDGERELINGRYRLLEVIGQGGMGTVWRGHDEMLDREVAIKRVLFPPDVDDDERAELTTLALREARATARLNHPGVVTIYDVIDDGSPVIVMEFIEGRSLADILREEVRLPYRRVAEIGAAVLDALREAHAAGIVHRDLKPANILITDRRIVLTDFGVAQRVGERAEDFDDVLGTPAFMAPEQAENAAASPAADLWSLGAVMFNAVEGRPPFQGPDHATVLLTLLTQDAPALVNGGPLKPLIASLLVKDPERRPTAEETAERLKAVLRQDDDSTSPAQGRPAIAAPDAGKGVGRPDPGRSASPPPSAAKPTSPGPGAPASGPKPAAGPVSLPPRPHRVRPAGPNPHHLPAPRSSSEAQRFKATVAGPVVAVVFLLGLYLFTHISSGGSASSGVNPSPSDPFDGLPGLPSSAPSASTPPEASPSPDSSGFEVTAVSPDGKRVAFGGESGVVWVYDTASHKLLSTFDATPDDIQVTTALAFSPDGRTIAVAAGGPTVIWDIAKRKRHELPDFRDVVSTLRFNTDGRTLTAVGAGGTTGVWTVRTGEHVFKTIPLPKDTLCLATSLSVDGRDVACGYYGGGNDQGGVIVWDVANNRQAAAWPGVHSIDALAISPDGRTIAFADSDNLLQVWDVAAHRQIHTLGVKVDSVDNALVFGSDGKTLAVPSTDTGTLQDTIEIWDVSREQKMVTLSDVNGPRGAAMGPKGTVLATAEDSDGGTLWSVRSGKRLASWRP